VATRRRLQIPSTTLLRISYFALLATAMCAALSKESRMEIIKATGLDRKSGERSGGICSAPRLDAKFPGEFWLSEGFECQLDRLDSLHQAPGRYGDNLESQGSIGLLMYLFEA
jgi:hypothetical protein